MFVNLSNTCATSKLVQIKDFGLEMCSVFRKFEQGVERATDIAPEDFVARKKVYGHIMEWCEEKNKRLSDDSNLREEWYPILYQYEVRCYVFSPSTCQLKVCFQVAQNASRQQVSNPDLIDSLTDSHIPARYWTTNFH